MTNVVKYYTKLPVTIQAYRITNDWEERREGYKWVVDNLEEVDPSESRILAGEVGIDPITGHMLIGTLEGTMTAKPGDWIIQGINGEFYPCKDDIFQRTYVEYGEPSLYDEMTGGEVVDNGAETMEKVYFALSRAGLSDVEVTNAVTELQNAGILFRERM